MILTGPEAFEVFKKEMLLSSTYAALSQGNVSNKCIPVVLDRDVLFERTPDVKEEIPNYKDSGVYLLRLPFPSSLSSETRGRYGKKILFPRGDLVIMRTRVFEQESLPQKEWITKEIPYALLMSIYDLKGDLAGAGVEDSTVFYNGKKVLAEETFYDRRTAIFRGHIHLKWDEHSQSIYERFCSRYPSLYEKGSLLDDLSISLETFLSVFSKNLVKLEEIISILH